MWKRVLTSTVSVSVIRLFGADGEDEAHAVPWLIHPNEKESKDIKRQILYDFENPMQFLLPAQGFEPRFHDPESCVLVDISPRSSQMEEKWKNWLNLHKSEHG